MRLRDSIALKRTICCLVMGGMTLGMMLFHTSQNAANYVPDLHQPEVLQTASQAYRLGTVEEPADSRQKMTISFLGNCLVGSMLGSDAYGTFNEMILSEGPDYFLAGAVDLLEADDWTVAALSSVDTATPASTMVAREPPARRATHTINMVQAKAPAKAMAGRKG